MLVLGGGPAGSAAAITAARAGLRVTLVEREAFPRAAPGESLHPGIQPLLRQLGVEQAVLDAGFLRHSGYRVAWGGPAHFEAFGEDADGPWRGFQAWRPTFDAILLEQARSLGVRILQPATAISVVDADGRVVGVQLKSGPLLAEVVVDATGRRRLLSRWLALRWRQCGPRRHAWYGYAHGHGPTDETPFLSADHTGWSWIAQVRPDVWAWTRLNFDGSRPDNHWCPPALNGLRADGVVRGADVTWQVAERPAGPGYFLTGDAAAILDPASSHGVLKALMSGLYAAHLAAATKSGKAPSDFAAAHYTEWLHRTFDHDVVELERFYARLTA